ncbi:MAG: hypothetical protein HYW23_00055 [Candidatus Aenigmarchaeota archaeon]|nr:hypothetical protein [Candidatus Aenigmarchaeota archaeon]
MGLEHKITGVMHLGALSIIALHLFTGSIQQSYVIIASLFFIVKGIAFTLMKQNPLSLLDTVAGVYLMFPVLGIFSISLLNIIFIVFLAQKGLIYLLK